MIQFYRSYTSYVIMILAYTFLYVTMISNTRLIIQIIHQEKYKFFGISNLTKKLTFFYK